MKIGPSFPSELVAAGISPVGILWDANTGALFFQPNVSAADQTKAAAVLAAHDPTKAAPDQLLGQKLAAGCQITSASKPGLNGIYAIDPVMQGRVSAVAVGIAAGKGFPHGAATYSWPVAGGTVTFTATADFLQLASALEAYVSDLILAEAALATGNPATWPAQPVAIP